jgi:putative toxin-antitoxin system antitoxin component (TIGR02293 family)
MKLRSEPFESIWRDRLDPGHLAEFHGHMASEEGIRTGASSFDDNLKMAEIVQGGLPASALKEMADEFGLSVLELADVLQLARRTVTRRLAQGKRLTPMESERILRVQRLLRAARLVFEDKTAARRWFAHALAILGGKTPLELCATEPGGREVELVLGRIDHGVFG